MGTVKENLIAARALIDTPEKWNTNGSFGSDGCYCAIGALERAPTEYTDFRYLEREWTALWKALPKEHRHPVVPNVMDIFTYNDEVASHIEMMALFTRAIEAQP